MSDKSDTNGRFYLGVFLIVGPVLASAAKLAGLGAPSSGSGFSQGGQIGYWIGTLVSIVIGIVLVVKHHQAKNSNNT